jgi:hypothetical protein
MRLSTTKLGHPGAGGCPLHSETTETLGKTNAYAPAAVRSIHGNPDAESWSGFESPSHDSVMEKSFILSAESANGSSLSGSISSSTSPPSPFVIVIPVEPPRVVGPRSTPLQLRRPSPHVRLKLWRNGSSGAAQATSSHMRQHTPSIVLTRLRTRLITRRGTGNMNQRVARSRRRGKAL